MQFEEFECDLLGVQWNDDGGITLYPQYGAYGIRSFTRDSGVPELFRDILGPKAPKPEDIPALGRGRVVTQVAFQSRETRHEI